MLNIRRWSLIFGCFVKKSVRLDEKTACWGFYMPSPNVLHSGRDRLIIAQFVDWASSFSIVWWDPDAHRHIQSNESKLHGTTQDLRERKPLSSEPTDFSALLLTSSLMSQIFLTRSKGDHQLSITAPFSRGEKFAVRDENDLLPVCCFGKRVESTGNTFQGRHSRSNSASSKALFM